METAEPGRITGLLKAWVGGDSAARERLIPLVYNELRHLASYYRRQAGAGDTMQTTALVHEAYLRLVDIDNVDWHDRVHFFAVSAQLMRRILVDAAHARAAEKRGGSAGLVLHPNLDEIARQRTASPFGPPVWSFHMVATLLLLLFLAATGWEPRSRWPLILSLPTAAPFQVRY